VPELAKYVRPKAAELPAQGVKAMSFIQGGPVKIVLVGDSTVATEGGWGPGFCAVMTKNVTCVDVALNGRSSKSFRDEGAWKKALAEKGDYYLMQFGHNDQKADAARHTDPETTYAEQIRSYIRDARAIGAVPVVISPLARRTFKDGKPSNDDLRLYANAAQRVASEENVTFIDLLSLSTRVLSQMTQEQANEFNATGHADARAENGKAPIDHTHLNDKGKAVFGRIVADNLMRTQVELGPDVVGVPIRAASAVPQQAAPTDGK
jgi:lysophospholipase L1-like esterase